MTVEEIKATLRAELSALLQQDADFRVWLEDLIRRTAVSAERFDARFDRVLRELAADREEQARKWDEQQRFNQNLLEELRQTRVRPEARPVAERLGIEIFGSADEVSEL
jgi:hypothetical protein